ncbi:aspartate-semialdehyde dehydrogenase [Candidatus Fermentibacterales bacterium]|nr:aspartate-semialdehyde dehydrogenase [Candidatus Fermentibacterales bacterium]
MARQVGVVGATGLVGRTMLAVLHQRGVGRERVRAFASERSSGSIVPYGECADGITVELLDAPGTSLEPGTILLGATSSSLALQWVPRAVAAGALVVDNSSAYRMDPAVPLVVPEANPEAVAEHHGIIANPNCSTIQLVVALKPLTGLAGVEWVAVSTYQAASGAGQRYLDRLAREQGSAHDGTRPAGHSGPPGADMYFEPLHENIIPTIAEPEPSGYCLEEIKLMRETSRILSSSFPVFASCARVPVRTGHTESVAICFDREVGREEAAQALRSSPGLQVHDHGVPPRVCEGRDEVFVGRIRTHPLLPRVMQLWITADNLRKGAALNAVQIAELAGLNE